MNNCLSQNVQIFQNYILVTTRLTTHFGLEMSVLYEELLHLGPKIQTKFRALSRLQV